jgi:hypothetical protein
VTKIKIRRGTAVTWTSVDPVLAEGEPGYEIDTRKLKFGDGVTRWSDLPYVVGGEIDGALIEDGTITTGKLDAAVDAAFAAAEHTHPVSTDVPLSASATGVAGSLAMDSDYLYVCVATDTWKRATLATWS